MVTSTALDSQNAEAGSGTIDFHKAITIKERSSRYLRTAIDYVEREKGREACDEFLAKIALSRDSSVFKHIYDDENWNSYELEVYLYDRLKDLFDDPYQAIWNFGVASGSGLLDQKDTLFAFRLKVAPVPLIVKKTSEHASKMSLISDTSSRMVSRSEVKTPGKLGIEVFFNYVHLPPGFEYPHWTSVLASFGIVYGLMAIRKGLKETELTITHWPCLPSDFPSFNGKTYTFEKKTKNVVDAVSGEVIANARRGPFELDGIVFNHAKEAVGYFEYRPESFMTRFARATWQRRRLKRENELRELKDALISELGSEHQAQLARYESELSEKMEEIRRLKVQQDGDYFLTSLLTKPLMINRNNSETVSTEFLLRQKKRFEFRQRRSELGGDICMADRIQLLGRNYVVIANGDAMGKSMQGAGGALVLGVVLQAFLSRTHFSEHQRRKTPELWLRDCYYELQNVFLSFDGSMYLSMVMGLIDEVNGTMYYVNAEHPGTILYRNGKAEFIDADLQLRKLGTPGEEDRIAVRLFQLEPGDVLIAGSDGRDDLELGVGPDGVRQINEDETLVLKIVEERDGQLEPIVEALQQKGALTDDLSLLRVGYRANEVGSEHRNKPEYQRSSERVSKLLRQGKLEEGLAALTELLANFPGDLEHESYRGRVLYKLKRYPEALQALRQFCALMPSDTEALHLLSVSEKKTGDYARALDAAQRVTLREPTHVMYIINEADCHRLLGEHKKAREVLGRAAAIDAAHPQVERLQQMLSVGAAG